jgi:hypothetical protein
VIRRRSATLKRRQAFLACVAALVVAAATLLSGCTRTPPLSLASTGDSIPRAFDACGPLADCTQVSYATGSDPSSDSLYRRLLSASPGLAGHAYNDAEVGARAEDLYSQMSLAVWQKADVVTVLVGANDACADSVGAMTPVHSFSNSITSALGLFFNSRPGARVVMSSIPDLYRVWQVAHGNARARLVWKLAEICPSMLANPTSTAPADKLRRVLVQLQINKYNQALAAA